MKNYSHFLTILLCLGFTISCNKTYDEPPVVEIPEGTRISISDLKDMFTGSPITLDSNYSIYGNITCEETNGNFYKEAYIQDLSGAIKLKLDASGGLYIGDSVRVSLNGVTMSEYGDLIQLDNISVDEQIVKIATDRFVTPYTTSINNLNIEDDQSRLIKLDSVEFQSTNVTYADAINLATGEIADGYESDGLMIFPTWQVNSIVYNQNMVTKLPSQMAAAAIYGANFNSSEAASEDLSLDPAARAIGKQLNALNTVKLLRRLL